MGLGGVEIDRVSFLQHHRLTTNVELHLSFEHHVELLSWMGVLIDGMSFWLGLDSHDEHIGLVTYESTNQRLVFVSLRALDGHALSFSSHVVRLHVGCLCKDQFLCRYTILTGNLHQVRDGDIQLALLDFLILL